jgi:hypothetical protein
VIEDLPMSQKFSLNINGGNREINADPGMPLLAAAAMLLLSANRTSTVRQAQLTAQLDKETIPWTEISLYHQVIFTPV